MPATPQIWTLSRDGRAHRVEASGSTVHEVTWSVDGKEVGRKKTMDEKVPVEPADEQTELGRVLVRFSALGQARRATLFSAEEVSNGAALTGLGGVDLRPAEGSPAAAYEAKVRENPTRYAALQTLGGVGKVVVPLILIALLARLAVHVPWPDLNLPSIPWPDVNLPSIPWPDINLPSIPWPDWSLPGWLRWVLDHLKYVWPVVLALVLARGEVKRRRKQDELRRADEETAPEEQ